MKYAISTDGNYVSQHFGRCPSFTLLDIENGNVDNKITIDNPGHNPGFIPKFLNGKGVGCIICGGIGHRAIGFFDEYKIKVMAGIDGSIDEVIEKLKSGALKGGVSSCKPGDGRGYGVEKTECDHDEE